jgi:beta-glucanase (GH16 family)
MINLINPKLWNFEAPWGSTVNPNTTNEIIMVPELVSFMPSKIYFMVGHGKYTGYKRGRRWNKIETTSEWGIGHIVAKDSARTHFGTYKFRISLPNFRGAWPAIWLVDMLPESENGMGMPPEIDIFEHFRKDWLLTRFHMTLTFHQGPTYENNKIDQKTYWKLWPLDKNPLSLTFHWFPDAMTWIVNGREIMKVTSNTPKFPTKPMNLLMGAGIGTMWKPQLDKLNRPFIVHEATYDPYEIVPKRQRRISL